METLIGEVRVFSGDFAPRGWASCDGQTLLIADNSGLFSVIGITYGGNGTSNFKLPDLRGRTPVHFGSGAGLNNVDLGQSGGVESVILSEANLPSHVHEVDFDAASPKIKTQVSIPAREDEGTTDEASGAKLASGPGNMYAPITGTGSTPVTNLAAFDAEVEGTIDSESVGSGSSFNTRSPYQGLNYIIALVGCYPAV